jgi:hypothetical protein
MLLSTFQESVDLIFPASGLTVHGSMRVAWMRPGKWTRGTRMSPRRTVTCCSYGRHRANQTESFGRPARSPRIGTGTLGTTHNVGTIFGLHFVNLCVTQLRWRVAACLGVAGASLVSTTSCARQNPPHARLRFQSVLVEEYVSDLPVGTAIHLCLERMRCRTNTVSWAGRSNPPQIVSLPLPSGASSRAANGWTLRGYATSRGVRYRGSTRLIYHIAVDPPCKCAGDYAYLTLRPPRR